MHKGPMSHRSAICALQVDNERRNIASSTSHAACTAAHEAVVSKQLSALGQRRILVDIRYADLLPVPNEPSCGHHGSSICVFLALRVRDGDIGQNSFSVS